MKKISRRKFIQNVAAGAAGVSALSLLPGLSLAEEPAQKWDLEADVVVAGTGTVIMGAIAANEFGAGKIVVLEKSETLFGGTSVTSGGGMALPGFLTDFAEENNGDTREKCLSYMKACGEDRMSEEVMTAFVDTAQEWADWAKALFGWHRFTHSGAHNDYYELYRDSILVGRGAVETRDADGNRLYAKTIWADYYRPYVEGHENMTLMMGTAAERLIQDENNRVIGVIAKQGDTELRIKANKGVILGTGGFDYNEEMRRAFLAAPIYRSCSARTNTGDGQRMGAQVGGRLAMMDRYLGVPFAYSNTEWGEDDDRNYGIMEMSADADWAIHAKLPHTLIVNRKGKRFMNESHEYDVLCRPFNAYDNGLMKFENIPAFFICDSEYAKHFKFPGRSVVESPSDYIFKFDTLEELADGMGIDKKGLLAQVERFNQYVADGYDPEWHRGESANAFQTLKGSGSSFKRTDYALEEFTKLTDTLGTVEKAPFYCCRYVPGTCSTRGGLVTNGRAQVLDNFGEVIQGLYATGTCSAGVAGYWAGGACISQGYIMSYIAAKDLCGKA